MVGRFHGNSSSANFIFQTRIAGRSYLEIYIVIDFPIEDLSQAWPLDCCKVQKELRWPPWNYSEKLEQKLIAFAFAAADMNISMLFEAITSDNVDMLCQLLDEDPDVLVDAVMITDHNPLHTAAKLGHLELVKVLLSKKPSFVRERDRDGNSPLHLAAENGHIDVVKELLAHDPQLTMFRDKDGRTLLHCAAIRGKIDIIDEVLNKFRYCIEDVTARGETPLHLALKHNQDEAFLVLMNWVKQTNSISLLFWEDKAGNTVFRLAFSKKNIKAIFNCLLVTSIPIFRALTAFEFKLLESLNIAFGLAVAANVVSMSMVLSVEGLLINSVLSMIIFFACALAALRKLGMPTPTTTKNLSASRKLGMPAPTTTKKWSASRKLGMPTPTTTKNWSASRNLVMPAPTTTETVVITTIMNEFMKASKNKKGKHSTKIDSLIVVSVSLVWFVWVIWGVHYGYTPGIIQLIRYRKDDDAAARIATANSITVFFAFLIIMWLSRTSVQYSILAGSLLLGFGSFIQIIFLLASSVW